MSRLDDAGRALRVGVVVGLAGLVLVTGVWLLGESSRVWDPKVGYRVTFANVQGLTRGSAVSVAGYTIGTVKGIRLPEKLGSGQVVVDIQVERDSSRFIRANTRARLRTMGLLGDRYIDLSSGTIDAPELQPGAIIQADDHGGLEKMLEQGESVAENMEALSAKMLNIVDKINSGEGLLGSLIMDTTEGRVMTDDIKATVASLRAVADKVNTGSGLASTLVNDPAPAAELKRAVKSIAELTQKLEHGDGLVGRAFTDKAFADELITSFRDAGRHLADLTGRLDNDRGLVARLMRDEAYADELLENLRQTSASVAVITRRIEAGEGSLGLMLADDTLYQGVNDLVAGARKSRLTRWVVTRSQKIGAEERLQDVRTPQQ